MNARDQYLIDYKRVRAGLPGNRLPWLKRSREGALQKFADLGFPTVRDEEWKHTNIAPLAKQAFAPAVMSAKNGITATHVQELSCRELACDLMVFVNGIYARELSTSMPAGTMPLAKVLEKEPETVESFFGSDAGNSLASLNLAFASDGAVVRLPKGSDSAKPIYLLFISTDDSHSIHVRNLIVAEEGSRATIVEHYCGLNGAAYFTNSVTQIAAGKNCAVAHYKMQQEGANAFHIANIDCVQQAGSRFDSHSLALGAALSRNEIGTCFAGAGAQTLFNGLYVAGDRQHMDHHTRIDHAEGQCVSSEFYRGVLNDHARAVFNGKVIVRENAQKTDSSQSNHNLLLSNDAEVSTRPQLEIYADDVKCTHGATVGQLDEDMIFYLRTRGVQQDLATAILTYAFAHDIIGRIELAPLRRKVADALIARLPERERIRELV